MKAFSQFLHAACAMALAVVSASAAAVGGLADLTVYDRTAGRSLPVYWHEGRAWVVGRPGNEYQLNLRNRQGEDLLAVLSVDGVNAITGETAGVQQSGYVLSPQHALEVKGWRKDLSRSATFYFTSLADSYAARTGRPDNVGTIGAALFRRKPAEPLSIAPDAPMARSKSERSDSAAAASPARSAESQLGTGHGRSETSHVRLVGFERATHEPAETIVIYYDSYRNLVARGVIPQPPAWRRPQPHPFPAFVPDPPG
jgi:hypothetical protein